MEKPRFKEGDWVKEKNGTQGMTVVNYIVDGESNEETGEVRCCYKNATGEDVETNFWEDDLEELD